MNMQTFTPREYTLADRAGASERGAFIAKTYLHLLGAVIALIGLEAVLLNMPFAGSLAEMMAFGLNGYAWLLVLGAFMGVSYIANGWAHDSTSLGTQYAGLGLYVVAWSFLLLPILYIAVNFAGPDVVPMAAVITLFAFAGLTAVVFVTRKNFSFLGPFLGMAGLVALGLIVCSIIFGFTLGLIFIGAMIALACGYILY